MKKNFKSTIFNHALIGMITIVSTSNTTNYKSTYINKIEVLSSTQNFTQTVSPLLDDGTSYYKFKSTFQGPNLTTEDYGVPILCYHSINPAQTNDLLLNPDKFRSQLKYLKDNNYTPITLSELYQYNSQKQAIPEKAVVLTFDDGYRDNYTYAFPILKEFNFPATIFVITDFIDNGLYMTQDQLIEMKDYGIEIQAHTARHEDLSKLSLEEQSNTLKKSKDSLDRILNQSTDFVAYPFGKINSNTPRAAEIAGFKMGFLLNGLVTEKKDNKFKLGRIYIANSHSMNEFIRRLNIKAKKA